jgi:NAD(P)-dependent dehydrogenase (short-subunit alcohol dehydrogenase family)
MSGEAVGLCKLGIAHISRRLEILLQDKIILVTGSGSGIGRATCQLAAQEGASIVCCDIDEQGGQETLRSIRGGGGAGVFVRANVADDHDLKTLFNATIQHFGKLDGAVNNAGIDPEAGSTGTWNADHMDHLYAVTIRGVFQCINHEVRCMSGEGGAIVNIGSVASMVGSPRRPAYVAAKHAIIGLTRTAAMQYGPKRIRVNAVCPGGTQTPLFERDPTLAALIVSATPLGRIAAASEIAEAVVWLLSDRSSYVTGHALVVDGGILAS